MVESLKPAIRGFLIWSMPALVFLAALYLLGSHYLVETHAEEWARKSGYSTFEAAASIREDAQWVAKGGASQLLLWFSIYWLAAAKIGVKRSLGALAANVLLLAGTFGLLFLTVNRFFYWLEGYCDQLPYPHEGFQILRLYECPSSRIFLDLLWYVSISLFLLSLIFRALHSRQHRLG